jgi:hypothetical protein
MRLSLSIPLPVALLAAVALVAVACFAARASKPEQGSAFHAAASARAEAAALLSGR